MTVDGSDLLINPRLGCEGKVVQSAFPTSRASTMLFNTWADRQLYFYTCMPLDRLTSGVDDLLTDDLHSGGAQGRERQWLLGETRKIS